MAWFGGAVVAFSGIDYIGYNLAKDANGIAPISYRIAQLAVQGAVTYILYEKCGLPTAIAFNVFWWRGGCDELYYGWGEATNAFPEQGRGSWQREHNQKSPNRKWTPLGIMKGALTGKEMVAQASIGLAVSIIIL